MRCACVCRYFLRNAAESQASEVELFLNSVPILNPLRQEEKLQLVDAFEEKSYKPGDKVGLLVTGCGTRASATVVAATSRVKMACTGPSTASSQVTGASRREGPTRHSAVLVQHTWAGPAHANATRTRLITFFISSVWRRLGAAADCQGG